MKPSPVQNSGLKRCHCHHDPPRRGNFPPLAATNKCLAESNKSCTGAKRLRSGFAFVGTGPLESIRPRWNKVVTKSGDIKVMRSVLFSWVIALPNLKTKRQWRRFIQAVIGWCRPRNPKEAARLSTFAAGTLTADRIDYWIRRRVLQYWDGTHPSQRLLNSGRDRRVGLSAIRHDRYPRGH